VLKAAVPSRLFGAPGSEENMHGTTSACESSSASPQAVLTVHLVLFARNGTPGLLSNDEIEGNDSGEKLPAPDAKER
jgi:hypothetical protein